MSRTDKTRPYWVQLRDPNFPWPIKAHHGCMGTSYSNSRECDLDFPMPVTRNRKFGCTYWNKWRDNDKIYGRGRYRRSREFKKDKIARADLRRLRAKWMRIERDDIDSNENLPTQRWLWHGWYWD